MSTRAAPVDVDFDLTLDDVADLPALLHRIRAENPAAWVHMVGTPVLLLTSHHLVSKAFSDETTLPAAAMYGQPFYIAALGRTIQAMAGEEHRTHRALVAPTFRPRRIPDIVDEVVQPIVDDLLDELDPSAEVDLVEAFTSRLPLRVILRLLGIPLTEETTFKRWAIGLLDHSDPAAAQQVAREFIGYVGAILAERRRSPHNDLLSELATAELDGQRLTDQEIFAFIALLFPAGADTTYQNLGSTLLALFRHRDQRALLTADPAQWARPAALEGARWEPGTAYIPRLAPTDLTWEGIEIPAGTMIMLSPLAANRDPAVFADPDRFDITRNTAGMMTFGAGTHFCLGKHLALAEMEVALRCFAQRFPQAELVDSDDVRLVGAAMGVLRGPNRLPVRLHGEV